MLSEKEKRVLYLIEENKDEIVKYLRKLISFKTITPPRESMQLESTYMDKSAGMDIDRGEHRKLQDLVYKTLEEMNFALDIWEIEPSKLISFPGSGVVPNRDLSDMPVVVGKLKGDGDGKSLILNGHYDVVPIGVIENWSHDPFKGEIENNKLFGRGACDMKGGIAAMLMAVKFIQQAGIKLNGDLTVETVPDEEKTSMGTLACCQKGYKADAAIIPEPTDMNIYVAMRGNVTGKITVFGRAGHADITQPHWTEGGAVNAISKAVKIILALEELSDDWRKRPDKRHKFLDPDIIIPTLVMGGEWVITYPEKVDLGFTSNFVPGTVDIKKEIQEKITSVANTDPWMREHPPKLEANPWLYGAEIDENEPIAKTTIEAAKELRIESKPIGMGSLTDAIHLINYSKIPTISIGPSIKTAHMANEFVEIDELINTTKVLALAILRWCGHS